MCPLSQVNISSAWFLPEEGFPVFYRFFDDRLTWDDAQAVCGSHHADLLSVQSTAEIDAAKAYLKEIDVADNIWIGLRSSPGEPFAWTNGEKLQGEGFWLEPVPKSSERLCAAIDPAADFRWKSYSCGGPQVGPFVCQIGVPEWAKQCLVKSLPSLTVTLLPEAGVVQLVSDCGLDGTRRIACNEKADRQEIMKRLSCDLDAFPSRSTTADALRDTNTQLSWSDITNQINRRQTTKPYHALTRHRRSAPPTSQTITPRPSPPSHPNPPAPPHAKPHPKPHPKHPTDPPAKPTNNTPANPPDNPPPTYPNSTLPLLPLSPNDTSNFKLVPVVVITAEIRFDPTPSGTTEHPPIIFLVEDDDPTSPPKPNDPINNSSLSPPEPLTLDLDAPTLTANNPPNNSHNNPHKNPPNNPPNTPAPPDPSTPPPKPLPDEPDILNTIDTGGKDEYLFFKPNRGRVLSHTSQPSFYPRILNRVLG